MKRTYSRPPFPHTPTLPHAHTVCAWILLLLLLTPAHAKAPTAKQILDKAAKQYELVADYTVEARVTVEGPMIHIPEMAAKIYYKKPDRIKMESTDGFAMLPRQGFIAGNPLRDIAAGAELEVAGTERVTGAECYIVKGTFQRDGRSIRSTVWVDGKDWLIRQIHTDSEWEGSVKVKVSYTRVANKYWLPKTTVAEVSSAAFPGARVEDKQRSGRPNIITVKFANYRVNTGLKDELFEKRKRGS